MDNILKLSQTFFYLTAIVIAILTYISAKKGLLNTVNTEYYKRVLDKIDDLSQKLISEFDSESPNYWVKKDWLKTSLDKINKIFVDNKKQILQSGKFSTGIPDNKDYRYLSNLVKKIKSDPFIPELIRNYISTHLENRANTSMKIYLEENKKIYG